MIQSTVTGKDLVFLQVVSTAVKELCLRFPMVAYSSTSLQLAVGRAPRVPGDHVPAESEIPAASLEPIAIFDMETGHKKRSLQCRYATDVTRCVLRAMTVGVWHSSFGRFSFPALNACRRTEEELARELAKWRDCGPVVTERS